MSTDQRYESYIVDIQLPPAVIVSPTLLTLGYALVLGMDYILIQNDTKLGAIINPTQLRCFICVFHFMLPILFASKYDFGNISFMIHPWSTAAQMVFLAKSNLSLKEWMQMMFKVATFQDESPTTDTPNDTRLAGVKKIVRGVAKFGFMRLVLDDLLPKDLSDLLAIPFYKPRAIFITYILAVRIYCMMGISDIIMGVIQALFLIRFNDIFNNPFISSSPKDFWNKRWNRLVSQLYHRFLFSKANKKSDIKKKDDDDQKTKSKFSISLLTPVQCGLLIFFLSGLIHDFMIAAAARNITFELTAFFLIHGIVVALEVTLRKGKYKSDPTGIYYIICNLLTVLFFTTTGRLFLSPILRQEVFLNIAQQF